MDNDSLIELISQPSKDMIKLHAFGHGAKQRLSKNGEIYEQQELTFKPQGTKEQQPKQPQYSNHPTQFINMFITNPYLQTQIELSQVNQTLTNLETNNMNEERTNNNNDLNYLVEKLINQESFNQGQERQQIIQKISVLKLNDKKLYNTKWITRLEQMAKEHIKMDDLFGNIDKLSGNVNKTQQQSKPNIDINKGKKPQPSPQTLKFSTNTKTFPQTFSITFQLKHPPHLKPQPQFLHKSSLPEQASKQKIKQTDTSQKQDSLSDVNQSTIEDEDIELIITYWSSNKIVQEFIEDSLNERVYPSTEFSIRSYLTHSQLLKVSSHFHGFWSYLKSKALNDLFLVRVLSLDDVLENKVQNITLLEKINAFRKYFDIKKRMRDTKKKSNQSKLMLVSSFLVSHKYELHGNKQLLQQLWDLYGTNSLQQPKAKPQKTQSVDSSVNISFSTRLTNQNSTSKSTQLHNLKFVQFIPPLKIHQDNYAKFLSHFAQLKKVYFNGMSVGFKGFRISNFTTRSQNNITFVFQDFYELVKLQALLIDLEFQLDIIESLRKQYEETPHRTIKKIRVKERMHSESKPWTEQMFQKPSLSFMQHNMSRNMSFSIMENMTMIKPPEPKFTGKQSNLNTTSSVNSSFFLHPTGYCQTPNLQNQSRRSKQIYFYKIDKQKPDYQKLIRHLNSITEVSKTVIIDFERMFELFTYKNKLLNLINVCCDFEAADLQLLPQPLEIVKLHEDYRVDLGVLRQQVREMLENEEKFACLALPNTQSKVNPINCFNIVKMNEEYNVRLELFKRIKEKYGEINGQNEIFNEQFEQSITTVQLIIPNKEAKNQFICFPFHNKTYKIARYYEPGSKNLLDLQLKQTNQRSENFIPSQETTFNQYKQRMIKQGVDFFYFCYPFGEKFKLNLRANNVYSMSVRNQLRFRKEDHLRLMYWLAKVNRAEYKLVFYQERPGDQGNNSKRRQEHLKRFMKEKLPEFQQLYEFGFVEDCLKDKIKTIEVYTGRAKTLQKTTNNHMIFKKSIQKLLLTPSGRNSINNKNHKIEAYRILTNRSTWDFVLKKLKTICEEKETQLRRMVITEEDDLEFQAVKKSLKTFNNSLN